MAKNQPEPRSETPENKPVMAAPDQYAGRWTVIRDLLAFQFKLAADGLRDLLLSPVSLALGLYGLIFGGDNPGKHFYGLMRLGHRTDYWINLFGAANDGGPREASSDELIGHVEKMLHERYTRGGAISNIKDRTDGILDRFQKPGKPGGK